MRTYNHLYKKSVDLDNFITELNIKGSQVILARVHSACHSGEEIKEVLKHIQEILPNSAIIGCSSSEVICDGKLYKDTCLISFTVFDNAKIITGAVPISEGGASLSGEALADKFLEDIKGENEKAYTMLFFPMDYYRIETFVEHINDKAPGLTLFGGTSYTEASTQPYGFYTIADTCTYNDMLCYAFIDAGDLNVYSDFANGVETVGKASFLETNGTVVTKVDSVPAGEWYAHLIGSEELKKNPDISVSFPLVIHSEERDMAYHVIYSNPKEAESNFIKTLPELPSGKLVAPGYFHPQKTYDHIVEILNGINSHPSESLFVYDCYARSSVLSNCARWELSCFTQTSMSGCLLYGEIMNRKGKNYYGNYTFIVSSMSENNETFVNIDIPDVTKVADLQEENISALNVLLLNSAKTLSKELDYQQKMIEDAVFYNPAVGIDNQLKFQYDNEHISLGKVGLLFLENEKMLRLFSGVNQTYNFLTGVYQDIIVKYTGEDVHIYSFQDTSLIVAATEEVDRITFEALIDKIQADLNSRSLEDITLNYIAISTINAKDNDKDPLSQLNITLEYARNNHLSRVRHHEFVGEMEREKENIRTVWIIREALMHGRVKPYFQEIHSNIPGRPRLFESLMRIEDAEGNLKFPDQFLPLAREYNLYDKLSETMVSIVMDMFQDKDCHVSINLSVPDIYNPHLLQLIFSKLKSAPKPDNFIFEIVESDEVKDYEYMKGFSDRVHEYGGKIAIDDFGSGFSNFMNVLRMDADYIKIDGGLIKDILKDPLVKDFVEIMQGWCNKNEEELICEYIENKEVQDIMEELGVAYSQGYYFSKPHPWGPEDEN